MEHVLSIVESIRRLRAWFVEVRVVGPSEARAKSEVGELDVPVAADQNVVWFYITVDKTHFVNRRNGLHKFGRVELGEWFSIKAR